MRRIYNNKKKKLRKVAVFGVFILVAIFLLPTIVNAGTLDVGLEYPAKIGLGDQDIRITIAKIIRIVLGFLGLIALSLIIYAGWLWMTSEGNEEKISKAKQILKNAVIGLIIILSAFAIVTFILNKLLGIQEGNFFSTGGDGGAQYGIGALGDGIIKSVYPEPNQQDVPRNTSIIVTFREKMNAATICDNVDNLGNCAHNANIVKENISIFKTQQGDSCVRSGGNITNCEKTNVVEVRASSRDNETFVFVPINYLGSPSEYIWYSVYLSTGIKKADNSDAFSSLSNGYIWSFEVSSLLDLTPPQVLKDGLFPGPDNEADLIGQVSPANQAQGTITVNGQPKVYQKASTGTPQAQGSSGQARVEGDYTCQTDGQITISIANTNPLTALVSGIPGVVSGDNVTDGQATLGCGLTLVLISGNFTAGNAWTINVTAEKQATTLSIGSINYTFVSGNASNNQISRGTTLNQTANNIATTLAANIEVSATVAANIVTIKAKTAGQAGNNIVFTSSDQTALVLSPTSGHLEGGKDKEEITTIRSRSDKPRNAVIQINFNEAVNPLTLSGKSEDINPYIRVVNAKPNPVPQNGSCSIDADCQSFKCENSRCQGSNNYLLGKFMISNQYKTVEFITNIECGVNSCGEKIYCLPANSHLKVELKAASLADCGTDNCASRSPFVYCLGNICRDKNDGSGKNYPLSDITRMDGVMDLALNSLDGNRNDNAQGPGDNSVNTYYNENNLVGSCASGVNQGKACTEENKITICGANIACSGTVSLAQAQEKGDNYLWSFFINDKIDLSSPIINTTSVNQGQSGVNLTNSIDINFSKLMMSSILTTGSVIINNGKSDVTHQLINLWSYSKEPLGYWVTKENKESGVPDGEADWTTAILKHTEFLDATSYRSQVGSGVKDIYQNCFKPCDGPACIGENQVEPSCCTGTVTASSTCP